MRYKHIGYKLDGYYKMVDLAHKYLNMSKSTKHKLKAIQHWEKYGILSSKDAFEISTSTLYRWNKLYHDYGLNGLQDKSKAPIRRKRRSAIWDARVIKFIRNYRHEHLLCGAHKIVRPLQEYCTANDISCPGVSTISRIISDNKGFMPRRIGQYPSIKVRRPSKPVQRRPAGWYPKMPGDCIAIDNIHLNIRGKKHYAITCIDLYTRLAFASVSTSISSKTASDFIDSVMRVFPFEVKRVLSDNGSEFKKHFEKLLVERKITQWKIYPGKPQLNAICERFNRTIKEGCLLPNMSYMINE